MYIESLLVKLKCVFRAAQKPKAPWDNGHLEEDAVPTSSSTCSPQAAT